jgi:FOG: CheY-like receiver
MIDEAAGGLECIRLAGEKQYDVIFLDYMMPDLNGIETLHRIRENKDGPCHSTSVVALTANAVSGAREMYLKEGFDSIRGFSRRRWGKCCVPVGSGQPGRGTSTVRWD